MKCKYILKVIKYCIFLLLLIPLGICITIGINQFIYYTGYFEDTSVADNKAPVHFYIINLDIRPDKLSRLKAQADSFGIQLTRIPAIHGYDVTLIDEKTNEIILGKDLTTTSPLIKKHHTYKVYCSKDNLASGKFDFIYESIWKKHNAHPFPLSSGEFGLLCSSRILWQHIASSPEKQISVVFEDDADLFQNFDKNIAKVISSLPPKWDIIHLDGDIGYHPVTRKKPRSWSNIFKFPLYTVNNLLQKIPPATDIWGTHGYMLHSNSAQKLLDLQFKRNTMPLDNMFVFAIDKRELTSYLCREKIMSVSGETSDITFMGRH